MPAASRPRFSGSYGIREEAEGLLDWSWAASRLESAHNYWLCATRPAGTPHARPVWAVWLAQRLCFSTDTGSLKARSMTLEPRVSVHLESADEVVILEGVAETLPAELVARLAEAYERKYDLAATVGPSGWYAIRPVRAYAWTEASFPATATRFDF